MKLRERFLSGQITLADIPPGLQVRILSMDDLPVIRRDHLFAFGLAPGRWVEIKQHRPTVVVQIDYTELALEPEVAEKILVERPMPGPGYRHLRRRAASRRRHLRRGFFHRRGRKRRLRALARILRKQDQSK